VDVRVAKSYMGLVHASEEREILNVFKMMKACPRSTRVALFGFAFQRE
jgi:hypothetical protein